LVVRYEYRVFLAREGLDVFTKNAKKRSKTSEYNIILTDEENVYSDLIAFIESHPIDNSTSILFHFYNIIIIFLLVVIIFLLSILIWLNFNQNKENITIY